MEIRFVLVVVLGLTACQKAPPTSPLPTTTTTTTTTTTSPSSPARDDRLKTVFLVVMENHNWNELVGKSTAPYLNSLLRLGAHAERYYNPPRIHPSEPNYLWLEAGSNLGVTNDAPPRVNHRRAPHLTQLLDEAGISWRAYAEDISGTRCPLGDSGRYAPRHVPFLFFDDVTDGGNPESRTCIAHVRPFGELAGDLTAGRVARYNFITPNLCDDMHDGCVPSGKVEQGDRWLAALVPQLMASAAYRDGGVIFITFDEGEHGVDGPIALIALSPKAKPGYQNQVRYDHSSTLRSVQEIFGVKPLLGGAATATNLADLFVSFP